MKVFIGCDHAAFAEKENLKNKLIESGHDVEDVGTHSAERCNYPDFATKVAKNVQAGKGVGILICGSGIGVSMVANRYAKVRAALCRTANEAELSRQHNDANVLCLGARINTEDELWSISDAWFKANFEGGRHTERIALFNDLGEN